MEYREAYQQWLDSVAQTQAEKDELTSLSEA